MNTHEIECVRYKDVKINNVDYKSAYNIIKKTIYNNGRGYVCVTDVGNTINASKDKLLLVAINSSLLSVADGMPLVWYARLAGYKGISRISGMDLMINVFCEKDGLKHYLLGDTDERINEVMARAREIDSTIDISGHSPPFKEFDEEDNRLILDRLNMESPDITWVSFGGGKQEKWMFENINNLKRGIMIGVGAAFKWLIGDLFLPPKIFQNMGLQWLFRTTQMLYGKERDIQRAKQTLGDRIEFCINFPRELISAREKK